VIKEKVMHPTNKLVHVRCRLFVHCLLSACFRSTGRIIRGVEDRVRIGSVNEALVDSHAQTGLFEVSTARVSLGTDNEAMRKPGLRRLQSPSPSVSRACLMSLCKRRLPSLYVRRLQFRIARQLRREALVREAEELRCRSFFRHPYQPPLVPERPSACDCGDSAYMRMYARSSCYIC